MALIKDGKTYRTLEEQVGYLTKKQGEQDEVNQDLQEQINDKVDVDDFETELNKKLDKVTTTTSNQQAYVKTQDGSQTMVDTSTGNGANTLAKRYTNGRLSVGTPSDNNDATTKKYVDDELNKKENKINIVEISSTSGTLTDEQYNLLSLNNTLIKYSNSYMQKILDNSTYYRFAGIHYEAKYYLFEVTKSTKEYTITDKAYNVLEDGVIATISGDIVGKVLTVNSSYKSEWKTPEIHNSNIISDNTASGYVLTSNGSNGATWQAIPAQTPEGTSIKSTGIVSGKVLTSNGSNGASWEDASGGSPYIITITGTTSGYLSSTDINHLSDDNVIIYNSTLNIIFTKTTEISGGTIKFDSVYYEDSTTTYNRVLNINTSNGLWNLYTNTFSTQQLTLNKYSSTSVNISTAYDILKTAKGNVQGRIDWKPTNNNWTISSPLSSINYGFSGGTAGAFISMFGYRDSNDDNGGWYFVTGYLNTSGNLSYWKGFHIKTDGTFVNMTNCTLGNCTIQYWNDVQLH